MTETEISLLCLIAEIREAAGDPAGKLMQDELVERVRKLADLAGKARSSLQSARDNARNFRETDVKFVKSVRMVEALTEELEDWVAQYGCSCEHPACRHCGRTVCARELIAKAKEIKA